MIALQGLTPNALVDAFPEVSLAEARKVISAVVRRGPEGLVGPIEQVRRTALAALAARGHLPALRMLAERKSAVDPFVKYLFETGDGEKIETVRIPLEHPGRFSVCVSSQVGCALGCAFCATGRLGLRRNLETWEIVEQVRVVRERIPPTSDGSLGPRPRVHGVVFQGMGEPLSNADRVLEAIRVMTEPSGLAIDARAITVCTSMASPEGSVITRIASSTRSALDSGSPIP